MKEPRDYQESAHWSAWNYIHEPANFTGGVATDGKGPKYPLVVEATGLGKSLNIAMMIWGLLASYPSVRIMQLCHVKELVESNYKELIGMWPAAPAGVYAAGLNMRDTRAQATFAMINSVSKRAASFGKVDFVLIDECHRLSDNDKTMYGKFLDALRKANPNLIVIGYTATDFRMKGGKLTDMGLFDDVVYDLGSGESFLWAVQQGYLVMPKATDPGFQLDDSGIGLSGGDYKTSETEAAFEEQNIIERAVDYSIMVAEQEGHKAALGFAQSIDHSDLIADMFTSKGYPCYSVHSRMVEDRTDILKAHKRGEFWGIINKDILTTGYNDPRLTLFVGLRLTRSPGLWVQMVGRMTRPNFVNHYYGSRYGHNGGPPLDSDEQGRHNVATFQGRWNSIHESGKLSSRILDFTGNTVRLGPVNYPNIPAKRGAGGGEPPVRTCSYDEDTGEGCAPSTIHHTSVKKCPYCGHVWPVQSNLNTVASGAAIVTAENPLGVQMPKKIEKEYKVHPVHQITAYHNVGKDLPDGGKKLDTVKIVYRSGFQSFNEWVCVEHSDKSFPKRKARDWWLSHMGEVLPNEYNGAPLDAAMAAELIGEGCTMPKFIRVWSNTKFPEIVGHDFKGTKFVQPSINDAIAGVQPTLHEPDEDPMAEMIEERNRALEHAASAMGMDPGGYDDADIPF